MPKMRGNVKIIIHKCWRLSMFSMSIQSSRHVINSYDRYCQNDFVTRWISLHHTRRKRKRCCWWNMSVMNICQPNLEVRLNRGLQSILERKRLSGGNPTKRKLAEQKESKRVCLIHKLTADSSSLDIWLSTRLWRPYTHDVMCSCIFS